ncbi:MAG TPA: HD domain-containing protein [Chryseosolibacter sp.]|nr:HD domain-containing protein [Chryseosolibacter sp.]
MDKFEQIIDRVREFTTEAHGTQTRRYSRDPYIVHPMRVMTTCRNYSTDLSMLCAAILHDVLEDTPVTKSDLENFLRRLMPGPQAEKTLQLVVDLTDVYTRASFPALNRRARREKEAERLSHTHPDAQTVKYADILDNTDVAANDPDFARTFLRECMVILDKMKDGHPQLRQRAITRVKECLDHLGSRESASPIR